MFQTFVGLFCVVVCLFVCHSLCSNAFAWCWPKCFVPIRWVLLPHDISQSPSLIPLKNVKALKCNTNTNENIPNRESEMNSSSERTIHMCTVHLAVALFMIFALTEFNESLLLHRLMKTSILPYATAQHPIRRMDLWDDAVLICASLFSIWNGIRLPLRSTGFKETRC